MFTKEEFKVLVMLYAANIDSNIHQDEVDRILEKTDAATYEKVRKMFKNMGDTEILSCIQENKAQYLADPAEKQQLLDVESVLEGCMFPKMDRACMYNSLENRAPFIDRRILELALALPDGLKLLGRSKKYILKTTFRDLLPKATVKFPKKGFDVPVDRWLRNDLRGDLERLTDRQLIDRQGLFDYDFIQTMLQEHFTGKENHKNKLWNLYVFQKWYCRIYG